MKGSPRDERQERLDRLRRLRTRLVADVADLPDVEKAGLAAAILSDTDPSLPVLEAFFDGLDDTTHGELISRAADQEERP